MRRPLPSFPIVGLVGVVPGPALAGAEHVAAAVLPGGAGYGLAGLALLAAGSLVWSLVLRRRVAARTQALQAARAELDGLRAASEEGRLRLDAETAARIRELDDTAAEFRAIVEAASAGIVLMRDRHIVHCNRRMDEIFGYAPGE